MTSRRSIAIFLISASWLGMIASLLYAVAVNYGGSVLAGARSAALSNAVCVDRTAGLLAASDWSGTAQAALWLTLALRLVSLWQLRRIGNLLVVTGSTESGLARALGALGLALAALGLAGFAFPPPELVRTSGLAWIARQTPGFAGGLSLGLGVVGAFALAGLLRETNRLRQENAGFV